MKLLQFVLIVGNGIFIFLKFSNITASYEVISGDFNSFRWLCILNFIILTGSTIVTLLPQTLDYLDILITNLLSNVKELVAPLLFLLFQDVHLFLLTALKEDF